MREDEFRQLAEQRQNMVVELRAFQEAADARAAENGGEPLSEDEEEFGKREKDLVNLNQRINNERRTRELATMSIEVEPTPVGGNVKSMQEWRQANLDANKAWAMNGGRLGMTSREADLPEYKQAIFKWIAYGRDGIEPASEEWRVLSKGASGGGFFVPTDLAESIVRASRFLPGGVGNLARTITT